MPPCPNRLEMAVGGPTAQIIEGGQEKIFPHKESNLESSIGMLKLQLKSTRIKLDTDCLRKVMTSFNGLKSEAQVKELPHQEADDEEAWIYWKQGKDLRDEETRLSPPTSPNPCPPSSPWEMPWNLTPQRPSQPKLQLKGPLRT